MSNPLEKLKGKYAPPAAPVADADRAVPSDDAPDTCQFVPGAAGWRGSGAICLLRAFLDDHRDLGAVVGTDAGGMLVMRFLPALAVTDGTRMRDAATAWNLLLDARDDVRRLVAAGEMSLKVIEKPRRSFE